MEQINLELIDEIIKQRSSVRDYQRNWNDQVAINKITAYCRTINDTPGPFGTKIKISLLSKELNKDIKLGTYGVIKGASNYLVMAVDSNNYNLFDCGYLFEKVVLYITSLGLGTVWMEGTYNRKHFEQLIDLNQNEQIIIVCPFGQAASTKSLLSNVISKSNKRKSFEKLFFDPQLKPINQMLCGDYIKVLEAVRLAPSGLNSQPWRMVSDPNNGIYHFYSAVSKQRSDINLGIALSHFELMMNQQYIEGQVVVEPNELLDNYKFSWKENRNMV